MTDLQGERTITFRVDLTDSRLGPGWRSVEVDVASRSEALDDEARRGAAGHYGVPFRQVGPVTNVEWR